MKYNIKYNGKIYSINDKNKPKYNCYEMITYILELWKIGDVDKIYMYISPQYRKELGGKKNAIEKINNHFLIGWQKNIFLKKKIDTIKTEYFYKFLFKTGEVNTVKLTLERQYDWNKNKPLYDTYFGCKYYFHYRLINIEKIMETSNDTKLKRIIDYCRI